MKFVDGCYVIAEIGVNHNGSIGMAYELIDAAAEAGADAVKFQTFFADDLVSTTADKAAYQTRNTGIAGSQHEMLSRLELDEQSFHELNAYCRERKIDFLSTPFGVRAADLLERVGVSAFKVSSGDLTYHQLLVKLARKGRPIILSTGMSSLAEVDAALAVIDATADVPVTLLHCVSDYPASPEACNINAMDTLRRAFGRPVGWSDHTLGSAVGFAAVALGASVVEKHITLDASLDGPDHRASMEPVDFRDYVAGIRAITVALGDGVKRPHPDEIRTAEVARRSIVAVTNLRAGEVIRSEHVAILRPGTGLPPSMLDLVIGCRLARDVAAAQPITGDDLHG